MWNDSRERQDLRVIDQRSQLVPSQVRPGARHRPVPGDRARPGQRDGHVRRRWSAGHRPLRPRGAGAARRSSTPSRCPKADAARIFSAAVAADLTWALSQGDRRRRGGPGQSGRFLGVQQQHQPDRARLDRRLHELAGDGGLDRQPGEEEAPARRDRTAGRSSGAGLPDTMFRAYLTQAHEALGLRPAPFPPPAFAGRVDPPLEPVRPRCSFLAPRLPGANSRPAGLESRWSRLG